jgi:hypothetical protein
MIRRTCIFVAVFVVVVVGIASSQSQYPILDMVANDVIQKYQNATCEQLWEHRGKPKSQRAQELIELLRANPQMRDEFINKVAAPIANKMFECGLIP